MMKRLLMPLVFTLSSGIAFGQSSKGTAPAKKDVWANAPIILSYEDFAQLTHAEQKTYVKRLREMMVAIDERDPKLAAELRRGSPFLAQLMTLTIPQAMAETKPAAKKPADADIENEVSSQLTEFSIYKDALIQTTAKKKLTDAEKKNLEARYKTALSWIGLAAINANSMQDEITKQDYLSQAKDALKEADALKAKVLRNMPEADRAKAEASFVEAKKSFVEPSIAGKIKPTDSANQFAKAAISFEDRQKLEKTASVSGAEGGKGILPNPPPSQLPAPSAQENKRDPRSRGIPAKAGEQPVFHPPRPETLAPPATTAAAPKAGEKATVTDGTEGGAKPAKETPDKTSDPAKGDAKAEANEEPANPNGYRCMHSGFVITGDACMAPSELPWDLANLDKGSFTCDEGKVMCNPFVFGVDSKDCNWVEASEKKDLSACWKNAKPFCVKPNRYATRDCDHASKSENSLESAVELIHANHKAFTKFASDVQNLCDKKQIDYKRSKYSRQRVEADIRETCKIAKAESRKVLVRFATKYPDQVDPNSKKAMNKGQPAKKQPATPAADTAEGAH